MLLQKIKGKVVKKGLCQRKERNHVWKSTPKEEGKVYERTCLERREKFVWKDMPKRKEKL